jgi:hypothetical protein
MWCVALWCGAVSVLGMSAASSAGTLRFRRFGPTSADAGTIEAVLVAGLIYRVVATWADPEPGFPLYQGVVEGLRADPTFELLSRR